MDVTVVFSTAAGLLIALIVGYAVTEGVERLKEHAAEKRRNAREDLDELIELKVNRALTYRGIK